MPNFPRPGHSPFCHFWVFAAGISSPTGNRKLFGPFAGNANAGQPLEAFQGKYPNKARLTRMASLEAWQRIVARSPALGSLAWPIIGRRGALTIRAWVDRALGRPASVGLPAAAKSTQK